jgi:VWFA-related protein
VSQLFRNRKSCVALLVVFSAAVAAPQQTQQQQSQQQQVPDAPSAVKPSAPAFPANTKPAPVIPGSAGDAPPAEANTQTQDTNATPDSGGTVPPAFGVRPMSPRPKTSTEDDGREQFTISRRVSFVTVPVTVKDPDGHLVEGLQRRDFSIFEDGNPEPISLFTSDPFPLSVAIVLDMSMPDATLKKVNQTIAALVGAFSQFDEVAFYTYGDSVQKVSDFTVSSDALTASLKRNARKSGRTGGVPTVSGPMASGPTVNGRPVDPTAPSIQGRTPEKETHVLNDAILAAAQDLGRRAPGRRKAIFAITAGVEQGSRAGYSAVLKQLLSHEIAIYGVGVDTAALPIERTLERIHVPLTAYGNILPKYVSATGGEYYAELSQSDIEDAYSKLTQIARNQYTLGYNTRATAASNYRQIEVRVHRPGLRVYAKDGYYPLPPQRMPQ